MFLGIARSGFRYYAPVPGLDAIADELIEWCRKLAICSDSPAGTTRTYLSPATHEAHRMVSERMKRAGLTVSVDAAGNVRGELEGKGRLVIGSHIDTVPSAGPFDGVLGVAIGIALVELLPEPPRYGIEVVAFSEEEGVRFGTPFIGSRALAGTLDRDLLSLTDASGISVEQAIRDFGLSPERLSDARLNEGAFAYIEFHIEQGPVLEHLNASLGVVEAIAGQSRVIVRFHGAANHAGTTPMHLRKDALAGAAEWIGFVEAVARETPGLVATVGRIQVQPGAGNVIAGQAECSLDIRHADDSTRTSARDRITAAAASIAMGRGVAVAFEVLLDQPAVRMDANLTNVLARAAGAAGYAALRMTSGAGHDAMILAPHVPATMLFLRSLGGISHHPDETVLRGDVVAALQTGLRFLQLVG